MHKWQYLLLPRGQKNIMFLPWGVLLVFLLFFISGDDTIASSLSFRYEGFHHQDRLYMGGAAQITGDGVLLLSNGTEQGKSYALYPNPIVFKNSSSSNSSVFSFSTSFVFSLADIGEMGGNFTLGVMYLVVSRTRRISPDAFLIGLDVISQALISYCYFDENSFTIESYPVYFLDTRMKATINYYSHSESLDVFLLPYDDSTVSKIPYKVEKRANLFQEEMYVGFYCETWKVYYWVMGWSFAINDKLPELRQSEVPQIPGRTIPRRRLPEYLIVIFTVVATISLILCGFIIAYYISWRSKFSEVIDGWEEELDFISHRFKYKDLYVATKGFKDSELLGIGGTGKVFRGVMHGSNTEVALKKIYCDSGQGMKEFIAEIVSLGRLHHRNIVPLLGYCRRKEELILVYKYMPNGSLDKFIHGHSYLTLTWSERFRIIKGLAYGILYLHEEWEQIVIHRDIKPGNVLLDIELNARLGDFGLAKLQSHGSELSTTKVVGTLGYLAPELRKTGKITKSSDMFAFGVLMLEVACGRRPIEVNTSHNMIILVDWVHSLWMKNKILGAVDPKMGDDYSKEEVDLVLKLGLLCCHSRPEIRATIREILGFLEDPSSLTNEQCANALNIGYFEGYDDFCTMNQISGAFSISHSLNVGR